MNDLRKELSLRVLIIDDDVNICRALGLSLKGTKCHVVSVHSVNEALAKLKIETFDLILTDFKMHGKSGIDLINESRELRSDALVVVMTAYASIENAIAVMKSGAYDYLPKPFTNDQFLLFMNRIQNLINLKFENQNLKRPWVRRDFFAGLTSPASKALESFVKKMAPTDATILLTGESGTGKSELAKLIHDLSPRSTKPFVTIYCTTLTESLLESELFGHVKGSFTGALSDKVGQLQAAEGGTLFLDEVGDLSPSGQAKLLRFLQEKVFQKVGGNEEISVDTRVIAATNKDLQAAVKAGSFREDLYYRLNILEFLLVALRHRKEDLPIYVERFIKEIINTDAVLTQRPDLAQINEKLLAYHWPGNLRELKNVLQRLFILTQGRPATLEDLPQALTQISKQKLTEGNLMSLEEVEKNHILAILEVEKNLENAAATLGITKATLWRKRKEYGLI